MTRFSIDHISDPLRLAKLIEALIPVLDAAGDAIMMVKEASKAGGENQNVKANEKKDGSPVTLADARAEAIILPALAKLAPDIQVISEEHAASHHLAPTEAYFLVDPLDGTKEFIKSDDQGAFTVNVGLVYQSVPVMGLVLAPAREALYWGFQGGGAFCRSAAISGPISVRNVPPSGAVAVASASHRDAETDAWLAEYGIRQTTSIGSSLKFALVAAGQADVYPRFGPTMEWDTAAGDAVLRAAGGKVCHPDGKMFAYGKPEWRNGGFIASGRFET
jgi:3'(2'), 5'-bisphosphate nucleotidase